MRYIIAYYTLFVKLAARGRRLYNDSMNSRVSSLVLAVCVVGVVGVASWRAGWFATSEPYEPPAPAPVVSEPQPVVSASGDIRVSSPLSGSIVPSVFDVRGEARGIWYFEASFPVQVRAPDGALIAQAVAHAQGEWMTESFVPFVASFDIAAASTTYRGPALLILMRDNPSGLPEKDDSVTVPLVIQY